MRKIFVESLQPSGFASSWLHPAPSVPLHTRSPFIRRSLYTPQPPPTHRRGGQTHFPSRNKPSNVTPRKSKKAHKHSLVTMLHLNPRSAGGRKSESLRVTVLDCRRRRKESHFSRNIPSFTSLSSVQSVWRTEPN